MVFIKTALLTEAQVLYDYTHVLTIDRKIPFLIALIIEAWEAIRLLYKCLKSGFSIGFQGFDCTWAQNIH